MTLRMVEPGRFAFDGAITFDNASEVDKQGMAELKNCLQLNPPERCEISLQSMKQVDSSALSVCLSWVRLARKHHIRLCFTDIPRELHALASVCGISEMLNNVSCPPS